MCRGRMFLRFGIGERAQRDVVVLVLENRFASAARVIACASRKADPEPFARQPCEGAGTGLEIGQRFEQAASGASP